jgi:hypothetical protein
MFLVQITKENEHLRQLSIDWNSYKTGTGMDGERDQLGIWQRTLGPIGTGNFLSA